MIKTVNMNIVEKALKAKMRGVRFFPQLILSIYGLEIPHEVTFKAIGGEDSVRFVHRAPGTVFHPKTTIGNRVHIYISASDYWQS